MINKRRIADVSVVIPTFNRSDLLQDTIRSVLTQTLPPREIIVVDNGSDDQTRQLIAEQFGRAVRYLYIGPVGVQNARNAGIAQAKAGWIATLDDDDLWEPSLLEEAAPIMADGRADLIYCNHRKFRHFNGEVVPFPLTNFQSAPEGYWDGIPKPPPKTFWSFAGRFPVPRILCFVPFYPSQMLARRGLIDRVGGYDPRMRGIKTEDIEFLIRMLLKAELAILWRPLVDYRLHATNVSGGDAMAQAIGRWQNFERMAAIGAYGDETLATALAKNLPERRVELFDRAWRHGRFDVTRKLCPLLRAEDWTFERRLKRRVQEAPPLVRSMALELRYMLPRNRSQQRAELTAAR